MKPARFIRTTGGLMEAEKRSLSPEDFHDAAQFLKEFKEEFGDSGIDMAVGAAPQPAKPAPAQPARTAARIDADWLDLQRRPRQASR